MTRKITVHPKTTYSLRSTCEKWGVKKSRGHEKRLLLITGSGRSGTTYAAKTMQAVGLDIPHEKVGAHGTSSLFFLVDSDWYPMLPWYPGRNHVGERRSDFEFEHVVQIVRHPLKTIPSIGKIFNGLNYELFEEQGIIPKGIKNKMLRCAYMYYELNMLAEKQADLRVQLERYATSWPAIMRLIGYKAGFPAHVKPANKGQGYRASVPLTWQQLIDLDAELAKKIMNMTRRYGYEDCGT